MLPLCVAPFCVPTKPNSRLSDGATEALKPTAPTAAPTAAATAAATAAPITTHDFKLELYDSWGDGWNGNAVTVLCDGSPVLENATLENGTYQLVSHYHTSYGTSEPFSCDEGSVLTGTWVTGEFTSEVTFEVVDETCGNRVVSLGEFGNEIDYTVGPCSFATNESTAMKHDISTRKRGKGGDHITCACVCPVGTCDTPADKDKPACADCASCYAGDTDPCAKSTLGTSLSTMSS